jgi:aryl-alcohol dehydrogenase-like predicted oxidoreductase
MRRISRRAFTKTTIAACGLLATGAPAALAEPGNVARRRIPSSGEMIPIVGLGTNRYGVGPTAAERAPLREALARFHEWGGRVIDTAPGYGTSESVLGDLVADLGIRDELFLATKVDRDAGRDDSVAQMRDSARELGTDTIDLMQVHNLRGWRDALPVLREWKAEGRIRYIGITTSREAEYEEFEHVMRTETLDFVQLN